MTHLLSFYFPGNDSYHVQNSQNADDNIFFKSVKKNKTKHKNTHTKLHMERKMSFQWQLTFYVGNLIYKGKTEC